MQYQDTISTGIECLKLLGVEIPANPTDDQVAEGKKVLQFIFYLVL